MQFLLIFTILTCFLINGTLTIDVESIELKCPGNCPEQLPACLFYIHPVIDNKFYMCIDDQAKVLTCPEGSIFFPEREQCDIKQKAISGKVNKIKKRSTKEFVRRPVNLNKQMIINHLSSLEDRIKALEIKIFSNSSSNTNKAIIKNNNKNVATLEISDEIKQQIISSNESLQNSSSSINHDNKNNLRKTTTTTTSITEKVAVEKEAEKLKETTIAPATTEVSEAPKKPEVNNVKIGDSFKQAKASPLKLNSRLQLSNALFQMPVNDFHSNFGISNSNNDKNTANKINTKYIKNNNIFQIPKNH